MHRGGANQGDGIPGNQNIGIGRLAAAVDNVAVNAMVEDQQRSFSRKHRNTQIGIFRNPLAPDPGGIDHYAGAQRVVFATLMVIAVHAVDPIAAAQQAGDFTAGKDGGAVFAGVQHIGRAQAKRIDGAVGYLNGAEQRGIDGGLKAQRLGGRELTGLNSGLLAGVNKGLLPGEIVFGEGNKQPVSGFHTVAGDAAQDAVFADAFARRFAIGHRVAAPLCSSP